jgi:hypothetical protein
MRTLRSLTLALFVSPSQTQFLLKPVTSPLRKRTIMSARNQPSAGKSWTLISPAEVAANPRF